MKTRHDQSPDISEDDYNKFSDPEKKESKIHEKNQIQKKCCSTPAFPQKNQLVICSNQFCEIFRNKKKFYQNPRVKDTLELHTVDSKSLL